MKKREEQKKNEKRIMDNNDVNTPITPRPHRRLFLFRIVMATVQTAPESKQQKKIDRLQGHGRKASLSADVKGQADKYFIHNPLLTAPKYKRRDKASNHGRGSIPLNIKRQQPCVAT